MKKASQILYIVSAILGIIVVGTLVATGAAVLKNGHLLDDLIKQAGYDPASIPAEQFAMIVTTVAVVFFVSAAFPLISTILAVAGIFKKAGKGLHIANIVFGALGGTYVVILAAIFGLIAKDKK